jgi:hypothetical protein
LTAAASMTWAAVRRRPVSMSCTSGCQACTDVAARTPAGLWSCSWRALSTGSLAQGDRLRQKGACAPRLGWPSGECRRHPLKEASARKSCLIRVCYGRHGASLLRCGGKLTVGTAASRGSAPATPDRRKSRAICLQPVTVAAGRSARPQLSALQPEPGGWHAGGHHVHSLAAHGLPLNRRTPEKWIYS